MKTLLKIFICCTLSISLFASEAPIKGDPEAIAGVTPNRPMTQEQRDQIQRDQTQTEILSSLRKNEERSEELIRLNRIRMRAEDRAEGARIFRESVCCGLLLGVIILLYDRREREAVAAQSLFYPFF